MHVVKVVFDRRKLIRQPLWDCPSCGQSNSFGVLAVNDNHYIRKCGQCDHPRLLELPSIGKRIIYIDQSAISEMWKELADDGQRTGSIKRDPFYKQLFGQLDRLGKLMLVVCPYSPFHLTESKALARSAQPVAGNSGVTDGGLEFAGRFEQLRSLVVHLSYGTKFRSYETIRERQVLAALEVWLEGGSSLSTKLDPSEAVSGKINVWLDDLYPALDSLLDFDEVQTIHFTQANLRKALETVLNRWCQEGKKGFKDWYAEEVKGHQAVLLNAYRGQEANLNALQSRLGLTRLPGPRNAEAALMLQILQRLEDAESKRDECKSRADEFLASKLFSQVPTVRISAALWAGLAHRFAHSGQKQWKASFANDTRCLSAYLPYCDAIFVDNECTSLLRNNPARQVVPEGDRVYSMQTKDQFLDFLKSIETAAAPEHLKKVTEVYGDIWLAPSNNLLERQQYATCYSAIKNDPAAKTLR